MKKIIVLWILSLISITAKPQWIKPNGVDGGRVSSITENGGNLYAVFTGNLYTSSDGGTSWSNISLGNFIATGSLIFYGTDMLLVSNNGIIRSTNNGATWAQSNTGLSTYYYLYSLVTDGTYIVTGTDDGGYISNDGGVNWTLMDTNLAHANFLLTGSTWYAGTYSYPSNMFVSTDHGASWAPSNTGLYDYPITCLVANGSKVFAGMELYGVYESVDNGATWSVTGPMGFDNSPRALAVSGSAVIAGTDLGVYVSADNGATWVEKNNGIVSKSMLSIGLLGTDIFAGAAGGLYKSTDGGDSWVSAHAGVREVSVSSIIRFQGELFAATLAGIYKSTDDGSNWTFVNNDLTAYQTGSLQANASSLFVRGDGLGAGGIYRSINNGLNWTLINPIFFSRMKVSGNTIFAGRDFGGSSEVSIDNGNTWNTLNPTGSQIFAVEITSSYYFAATYAGVYRCPVGGTTWTAVNTGMADIRTNAIYLQGTDLITITNDSKLYKSSDNGDHWNEIFGNIPINRNGYVTLLTGYGSDLITSDGIATYLTPRAGNNWIKIFNAAAFSFLQNNTDLFVGSNNGLWKAQESQAIPLLRPVVTSLPASAPALSTIQIQGLNFGSTPSANTVFFGDVKATVTVASPTQLSVIVPHGASNEPVSVKAANLTGYSTNPFVPTFPGNGIINASTFAPALSLATGTSPCQVQGGDLDGDGKSDLVVTNKVSHTVSLYRNNSTVGAFSFDAPVNFNFGTSPGPLAMGDMNGDSKFDIVAADQGGIFGIVYRNTIAAPGPFSTGSLTSALSFFDPYVSNTSRIVDVDTDGMPDMVTSESNYPYVLTYRNQSTGPAIALGGSSGAWQFSASTNVILGDLTGDGRPELIVADGVQNKLVVFHNRVSVNDYLSFSSPVTFTTGAGPSGLVTADFDGDGLLDVAVTHTGTNNVSVFRNQITNFKIDATSLSAKVDFPTLAGLSGITTGDVDGDGRPDLIVANQTSGSISVFRNVASPGSITSSSFDPKVDFAAGTGTSDVITGDFNNDGKIDIVAVNSTNNTLSLFRNITLSTDPTVDSFTPPSGPIGTSVTITGTNFSTTPANNAVSFNGIPALTPTGVTTTSLTVIVPAGATTGLISVTVGGITAFSATNFTVLFPPTISSFTPGSGPVGTSVTITGTNFSTTPANNIVYFGATQATVSAATATQLTVTVPAGATYQPITVQVAGLTAYSSKPFVVTFAGGGNIDACSFAPRVNFATGTTPLSIYFGDLDGDGKADMVTGNQNANTISVFRNISTSGTLDGGSFAASVSFPVGIQPYLIVIGDVDGDGKLDLIIPNESSGTVSVLRNTSAVGVLDVTSFAAKIDFATGAGPHSVFLEDVDADGKPEMVTANHNSNTLSVLKNTCTPGVINTSSFAPKVDFGTGTNPQSVGIADLDGDGKPDLVVTNGNAGTNTLSVLRNTTSPGTINTSSFATKVDFTTGFFPRSLAIGDIDGDDKPDLTTANFSSNSISVLRNTTTAGSISAGSFAATVNFTAGSSPHAISISDIDGDGRNDIVVANGGSASIGVFKNQSTPGAFTAASLTAKVDFITGIGPVNLALGDVDGDGKNDMTVSNGGDNTFSVFRNLIGEISLPTITSFTPTSGTIGTSVTITGTNFTTPFTNSVEFNGVAATITSLTATTITVDVPAGAATGVIEVTIGCNTITSSGSFTFCSPPAPPITTNGSGCSNTAVAVSATGAIGSEEYRWYDVPSGGSSLSSIANFNTPVLTANTTYYVSIIVPAGGCESTRTPVTATVISLPLPPTAPNPPVVCSGSTVNLVASGALDGDYRWYDGATLLTGAVNSILPTPSLSVTKTYSVAIFDGTCESLRADVIAAVQPCSQPVIATNVAAPFVPGIIRIDLTPLLSDPENNLDLTTIEIISGLPSGATATIEGTELVINYNGLPFPGLETIVLKVCDLTDLCTTETLTINLSSEITVFNAISPNGDGKNDDMEIENIDKLPETKDNKFTLFNRLGIVVFEATNYNNSTSEFRGLGKNGEELPSGTYYYILEFTSGAPKRSGFIAVKK